MEQKCESKITTTYYFLYDLPADERVEIDFNGHAVAGEAGYLFLALAEELLRGTVVAASEFRDGVCWIQAKPIYPRSMQIRKECATTGA